MQSVFNVKHETRVPVIHNMVDVQAKDEAQAGRSQAEATKADNIALLERLKYVQGYQAQPRTRKSVYPCKSLPASIVSANLSGATFLHDHYVSHVAYCNGRLTAYE